MMVKRFMYGTLAIALATMTFVPVPSSEASGGVVGCAVGPGDDQCTFICPGFPILLAVWAYGGSLGAPVTLPGAVITGTCGTGSASCTADLGDFCTSTAATAGKLGTCTLDDLVIPDDAFGVCRNAGPAPVSDPSDAEPCPHATPHAHTYGSGGSTGARSDSASAGRTAGVTTVSDNNVLDCNGDGIGGDFDGDYEASLGGAFLGYGPWADEPICNYGLRTHGGTIVVSDLVFGPAVQFVIGADDTSGPVISTDPVTGETTCETDGAITPGDPTQDPTRDADDCLTPVINGADTDGAGTTCGAGGDGGYWVFLLGARVHEGGTGVTVNNPATQGTITA